jgi:hypothetical protein
LLGVAPTIALAIVLTAVVPWQATSRATAADDATSSFVPIGPVRLTDTRRADCGCFPRNSSTIEIEIAAHPAIADDAVAVAVTVTATATAAPGYVTAYPAGTPRPTVSTLNTRTDRTVANSAIIPVGPDGRIALFRLVPGELIVDVTGVFVPAETARAGRFVSVAARRLVDTREPGSTGGALGANADLTVRLPDGVASDATAVVVNVTTVGEPGPSHLSARPAGERVAGTSFLNSSGFGQAVASATIVPVSPDGFTIRSLSGGHVIVDFLGWFTGPSALQSNQGLFVPLAPRRLIDTRDRPTRLHPTGTIEIASPVAAAASLVTNVTIAGPDRAGFVTGFPAGTARPSTSTVNPAFFDHTLANLAITRVATRGVAYWSLGGADLIVDLTGYFTGEPDTSTRPVPPNTPSRSRVLIVGDSTLAGLDFYHQSQAALIGFDPIVDAASCRRLLRPSCRSDNTGLVPNTAYEAILTTPGTLDIVVVKAGYNDWFSDFPIEFDAVVHAARVKGAHTIVWLTYNDDVRRPTARRAYQENNADLRWLATLPRYSDVLLADWQWYSGSRSDWFADGTHVVPNGAWALADYISRWVAAVEHRPCTRPWVLSTAIPSPCPRPDLVGPVPDPQALY